MPFPVDRQYITETEQKLAAKFPTGYIKRMLESNGGELETEMDTWTLYPILDSSDKKRLSRTCNDVVRETKQAREWPGFPVEAIAIGGNGSGDQLVLLRSGESPDSLADEVYYWDHETGALEKIAESFSDLAAE